MSEIFTAAVRVRAEELSRKFSHERPDGRRCYTAIEGWSESDTRRIGLAENIASGRSLNSAVTLLMTSAGHRGNILNSAFNYLGLASYVDGNGEYFWVQMFSAGRPSGDTGETPRTAATTAAAAETAVRAAAVTADSAHLPFCCSAQRYLKLRIKRLHKALFAGAAADTRASLRLQKAIRCRLLNSTGARSSTSKSSLLL